MATLQVVARHPAVDVGAAKARQVTVYDCRCVKCGHEWTTTTGELPEYCPGPTCGKGQWWIRRAVGRQPIVKCPKCERPLEHVGTNTGGPIGGEKTVVDHFQCSKHGRFMRHDGEARLRGPFTP